MSRPLVEGHNSLEVNSIKNHIISRSSRTTLFEFIYCFEKSIYFFVLRKCRYLLTVKLTNPQTECKIIGSNKTTYFGYFFVCGYLCLFLFKQDSLVLKDNIMKDGPYNTNRRSLKNTQIRVVLIPQIGGPYKATKWLSLQHNQADLIKSQNEMWSLQHKQVVITKRIHGPT